VGVSLEKPKKVKTMTKTSPHYQDQDRKNLKKRLEQNSRPRVLEVSIATQI